MNGPSQICQAAEPGQYGGLALSVDLTDWPLVWRSEGHPQERAQRAIAEKGPHHKEEVHVAVARLEWSSPRFDVCPD